MFVSCAQWESFIPYIVVFSHHMRGGSMSNSASTATKPFPITSWRSIKFLRTAVATVTVLHNVALNDSTSSSPMSSTIVLAFYSHLYSSDETLLFFTSSCRLLALWPELLLSRTIHAPPCSAVQPLLWLPELHIF